MALDYDRVRLAQRVILQAFEDADGRSAKRRAAARAYLQTADARDLWHVLSGRSPVKTRETARRLWPIEPARAMWAEEGRHQRRTTGAKRGEIALRLLRGGTLRDVAEKVGVTVSAVRAVAASLRQERVPDEPRTLGAALEGLAAPGLQSSWSAFAAAYEDAIGSDVERGKVIQFRTQRRASADEKAEIARRLRSGGSLRGIAAELGVTVANVRSVANTLRQAPDREAA